MLCSNSSDVLDDSDCLEVLAIFHQSFSCVFEDSIYAISDGGADSYVLGQVAHVVNCTGR